MVNKDLKGTFNKWEYWYSPNNRGWIVDAVKLCIGVCVFVGLLGLFYFVGV